MAQFDNSKTTEPLEARIGESMHSIGKAVFRTRDVDEKNADCPMAWS
jgi:hypothetical protein